MQVGQKIINLSQGTQDVYHLFTLLGPSADKVLEKEFYSIPIGRNEHHYPIAMRITGSRTQCYLIQSRMSDCFSMGSFLQRFMQKLDV